MAISNRAKKVTTHTLQEMKQAGEKITMLTSYDYSLARLVDAAGIDVILVGDLLPMSWRVTRQLSQLP